MARQRTAASLRAHRPPAAGGGTAPAGRDDVLGQLRRAVDEAVPGRGLIVLLTGEAGISKTTRALAAGAVTQARAAGDPPTLAACLLAQHNAVWAPGTAGERRAMAAEVAALAGETGDRELLLETRLLAASDLLELADPAFRAELDEFLRLADAARQPRLRHAALARRAMLALLGGRFAEAARLIGQAAALGEECGEPGARDVAQDQERTPPGPVGRPAGPRRPPECSGARGRCGRWGTAG